jgi:hypothetical protein
MTARRMTAQIKALKWSSASKRETAWAMPLIEGAAVTDSLVESGAAWE